MPHRAEVGRRLILGCMNALVSLAFDLIGRASSALGAFFPVLADGNTDIAAALVSATCLLCILSCHDLLASRMKVAEAVRRVGLPLAALFVALAVLAHAGSVQKRLKPHRITEEKGAWRITLPDEWVNKMKAGDWHLIYGCNRLSLQQWILSDPRLTPAPSRTRVLNGERGQYHLRERLLIFSTPDGSDPRSGAIRVSIVETRPWLRWARVVLCAGYVSWALWLVGARLRPVFRGICGLLLRERLLLGATAGFFLFFGAHQWRFLDDDDRMQMVTSRDDDGYMFARLAKAAELKTMDPLRLENHAYGAISFYPFAFPAFVAGHAGLKPSVELLNLWTRGLKLVFSTGALLAVWLLGAGRFGRAAAFAAMVLLGTNIGFLSYSSYPFYPDVLMAMLAALSLHQMLKLCAGWNPRAFSLAAILAAMSVSLKFITFLLFPLLLFTACLALWRDHPLDRRTRFRTLVGAFIVAGMLSVAVFFLCNPYLDYNLQWIVPNYKMCGNYYSTGTSQIVAGAAATPSIWIDSCYRYESESSDLFLAVLAMASVLGWWVWRLAARQAAPGPALEHGGILLFFALLFQLYLFKTVTLTTAIDRRLLLPVYPIFYLLAVWGVVRLARPPGEVASRSKWCRGVIATVASIAAVVLMTPRLAITKEFFLNFGREPETLEVSAWLDATEMPDETPLVTSLQSWFPPRYRKLSDGLWRPQNLRTLFYQTAAPPGVFFEDELYYDLFYSRTVGARGFNTQQQQELYDDGSRFYHKLRSNRLVPFVLAAEGRETFATNTLAPDTTRFRAYVNPDTVSEDLSSAATIVVASPEGARVVDGLSPSLLGGVSFEWPSPVSARLMHLITTSASCEPLRLRMEDPAGRVEELAVEGPEGPEQPARHRFLKLEPPRDIRRVWVVLEDGRPCDAGKISLLRVHPPVPVGLNVTRQSFELETASEMREAAEGLIAWRAAKWPGLKLQPQKRFEFVLTPKEEAGVSSVWIAFDAVPTGTCSARCTFVFSDGTRRELDGIERRSLPAGRVYFRFVLPEVRNVTRIECEAQSGVAATLRQVWVESNPQLGEKEVAP